MNQSGVLKRDRSVVGSDGKQQLVDLARKVRAAARRSDQTPLGVDANGNRHAATRLGISVRTLQRKLRQYDLERKTDRPLSDDVLTEA